MKITGLLLAAGAGTRFGGAKLLAEVQPGVPMCVASCRNLAQAVDEVVAVVRAGDTEVRAALAATAGVAVIECARAHEGMSASLVCGILASGNTDAWVVALADMPLIRPSTIAAITNAMRGGARIAAPIFYGKRGHPVGFAASLRAQLLACSGDAGARAVLLAQASDISTVETDDPGVLADIDTRAELARVCGEV